MYNLFDVVKYKTNIKGFWLDDNGKVYIDNIRIANIKSHIRFKTERHFLFDYKKQLAIFYIKFNKAYIEDREGNQTILRHCIRYNQAHISHSYIKALLRKHNGLTIYREDGRYTIEIWKA